MIDKNDKWKHVNWKYAILAIMVFAIAFACWSRDAHAHHGVTGESPQLAHSRDVFHVKKCDAFRYEGLSPDRAVCLALLSAVHRTDYHGLKADRRWVSNVALLKLIRKESGFEHAAVNPSSGACGLGQMLPCAKYGPGSCWRALRKQAVCVVRYVLGRYRTPENAWAFWLTHHWY